MPEVLLNFEALRGDDGICATAEELRWLDEPLAAALDGALYGIGEAGVERRTIDALAEHGLTLATAESCTGGLVGKLITDVAGVSSVYLGGVVSYANEVKAGMLDVPPDLLAEHGAVSEPVARAMAEGARARMGSDLSVSVTGIAGPAGGTEDKPVGTVHFAVADAQGTTHKRVRLYGNRGTVRQASAVWALKLVWDRLAERGLASIRELD
jgi:nicotinamide-nucleotide amidase